MVFKIYGLKIHLIFINTLDGYFVYTFSCAAANDSCGLAIKSARVNVRFRFDAEPATELVMSNEGSVKLANDRLPSILEI